MFKFMVSDSAGYLPVPRSHTNWVASWQNQQNNLCTQQKLNSDWASAHSDQSSMCVGSLATHKVHSEDWSDPRPI